MTDPSTRPFRSVLYVPGSNPRAIAKARDLPVDAVILDLEDAVAPDAKPAARETVAAVLGEGGFGPRTVLVRVNGAQTEWGAADMAAIVPHAPDGIVLPKVASPEECDIPGRLGATRVWAMVETPEGVLNAAAIARAPEMGGLVIGTNDLAAALGCDPGADRMPLMVAFQTCVLAARAAGIRCIDGVYNAIRDAEGLRAECEQGRALGMDGKSVIHPAQTEAANAVFAPTAPEIDLARRRIAAHEAAVAEGRGVAVLDGAIVEQLHVDSARRLLSLAAAIAARKV